MYIRVLGSLLNAMHGEALQCTQTVALYYINHITKTRTTFGNIYNELDSSHDL